MSTATIPTRRSFIQTAGAALSVPLAAAATQAPLSAADGGEPLEARLARLEDLAAIRALNQAFARHVNAGDHDAAAALYADRSAAWADPCVCGIAPDGFDEDAIDIAPDRRTATGRLHCLVTIESAIGPDCPLVEMARQQGGGVVKRTEAAVFENAYIRVDGVWKIRRAGFHLI